VLGVQGKPLQDARDELAGRLGGEAKAGRTVDDFLAAAPAANRYAWARGMIASLDPLGGQRVEPDVLLLAMHDFLVAPRDKWPFVGRVFRAFVDDLKRPKPERHATHSDPADALARWAAEADARERGKVPA
jgi:hypothetical protein